MCLELGRWVLKGLEEKEKDRIRLGPDWRAGIKGLVTYFKEDSAGVVSDSLDVGVRQGS